MLSSIVGVCAGTCTTATFLPQVLKLFREQKTTGISLSTVVVNLVGVSLWVVYGVYKHDELVTTFNTINTLITSFLLALYLKTSPKEDGPRCVVAEEAAGEGGDDVMVDVPLEG